MKDYEGTDVYTENGSKCYYLTFRGESNDKKSATQLLYIYNEAKNSMRIEIIKKDEGKLPIAAVILDKNLSDSPDGYSEGLFTVWPGGVEPKLSEREMKNPQTFREVSEFFNDINRSVVQAISRMNHW